MTHGPRRHTNSASGAPPGSARARPGPEDFARLRLAGWLASGGGHRPDADHLADRGDEDSIQV